MSRQVSAAALVGAAFLVLPLQALPQIGRWHGPQDLHERLLNDVLKPPASGAQSAPTAQPPVAQPPAAQQPVPQQPVMQKHHHGGPEKRLVDKYDGFAGSDKNALELVTGLRHDERIDLTKGGKTTSFASPTGKMGWGNVDNALALAKAALAEHGIHKPSPEQIKAALNGGAITTKSGQSVTLPGVLKLRASGMGWGQIAHQLGFKLGEVKRADKNHKHGRKDHDHKHADRKHHGDKHHHKHADWKHDRKHDGDKHHHKHADWKHGKHHRHDGKHDRHDFHRTKVERPDKHDKPHRPERPERHNRR